MSGGDCLRKKEAMRLAILAGEILLQNGAEITRVQETIRRILEAFGIRDHHIFVISNGIFATVDEDGAAPLCAVRHVSRSQLNLTRVAQVNDLAREIVAREGDCDIDACVARLNACAAAPGNPFWLQLLACAVGCACFAYILGGSAWDSCAAFTAGLALYCFLAQSGKRRMSPYIERILAGALGTLCCQLLLLGGVGHELDRMIIGVIMPLVPGVAITTAIRDFFNTDYLSGIIHLADAALAAASIAVGVGAMLYAWSLLQGVAL